MPPGPTVCPRGSPKTLVDGAEIEVDLDLVVLKSDQREGKAGVAAVPELKRHVESSLGKSVARSANCVGCVGVARTLHIGESGVGNESKLSGVANHLVVATLLLSRESELLPDVHPVTILAVYALTTDLNLYLRNDLLTRAVKPTGIYCIVNNLRVVLGTLYPTGCVLVGTLAGVVHILVNLGKSNLEVCTVGKITVAADRACYTATKVGLAVECLFNAF